MYWDVPGCSGMFRNVPGFYEMFWDVLWDVLGCSRVYWDVQGRKGMFWGFWDVLVILGCYGDSGMFLDVLGYTGMY